MDGFAHKASMELQKGASCLFITWIEPKKKSMQAFTRKGKTPLAQLAALGEMGSVDFMRVTY